MTIIPFPNAPKPWLADIATRPNTPSLIDTAIVALEAIDRPSKEVAMALAMLNAERLRDVGSIE